MSQLGNASNVIHLSNLLDFSTNFISMYVISASVSNKQISNKAQVRARIIKGKTSNVMYFSNLLDLHIRIR